MGGPVHLVAAQAREKGDGKSEQDAGGKPRHLAEKTNEADDASEDRKDENNEQ